MDYNYIINPLTNRKVSVFSKLGKNIIKNYIYNNLYGGASTDAVAKESSELIGLNEMPQLCLGTQGQLGGLPVNVIISKAFDMGYRHIDFADAYEDQSQYNWDNPGESPDSHDLYKQNVVIALKECIEKYGRENFWITWKSNNITLEYIKSIVERIGTHIDLFLNHHSCGDIKKMEILRECKNRKYIRYYGVSNCYNIDTLKEYQLLGHEIYANQLQAAGPNTKIEGRVIPENFYELCNSLGIRVMLFSASSALINSNIFDKTIRNNIVNWYIQKYINGTKNVIIVATISGRTLQINYDGFTNIIVNKKDILDKKLMTTIEKFLDGVTLAHM